MVSHDQTGPFTLRQAEKEDFPSVADLLRSLDLPTAGVHENIENFFVMGSGKNVIATVGLEVHGRHALLRSLGVAENHRGKGYGQQLVRAAIAKARKNQMDSLVLLTTTAKDFFLKFGFEVIPRDAVDHALRSSVEFCSACPATAVCMAQPMEYASCPPRVE